MNRSSLSSPPSYPLSTRLRLRPRATLACAALLTLLTACGPGGPKVRNNDDTTGGSTRATGITLVAGNFTENDANDGKGAAARFDTPRGIVIDGAGNLYVADTGNFAIRKIATDGTVSTVAGLMRSSGTANGNRARFTQPTALAIDAGGNLFVTDNYTIRKVATSGDVTTAYTIPSGAGNAFLPAGIAIDSANDLIVTTGVDTRRIAPDNNYRSATTLEAGQSAHYDYGNDVLLARGVAVNASNVAYVAALDNTVRSAGTGDRTLNAFAGIAGLGANLDGNAGNTRFGNVVAMTADKDGNLYAADAGYNTVRKITAKAVTSTVAGTPGSTAATSTGKLPGTLSNLRGIATDGNGNLYVTSGNAVFKIALP